MKSYLEQIKRDFELFQAIFPTSHSVFPIMHSLKSTLNKSNDRNASLIYILRLLFILAKEIRECYYSFPPVSLPFLVNEEIFGIYIIHL